MLLAISLILTAGFFVTDGQLKQDSFQTPTQSSSTAHQPKSRYDVDSQLHSITTESEVQRNKNSSHDEQSHDYLRVRPLPAKGEQESRKRHRQDHLIFPGRVGSPSFREEVGVQDKLEVSVPSRTELHQQQRPPKQNEQKVAAHITVHRPRAFSRKTERSMVPQGRPGGQSSVGYRRDSKIDQEEEELTSSQLSKVNLFSQLDSQRFQQPRHGEQLRRKVLPRDSRNRFIESNRTPVFDITRTTASNYSKSSVRYVNSHLINKDKYSPTAQPTDPVPSIIPITKVGNESRSSKPITFQLGTRRRIRYRPLHNKTIQDKGFIQHGTPRLRPLIRYVRPNYSSNGEKEFSIKPSESDLLNSKNESFNGSDLIPKPGTLEGRNSNISFSTIPATPFSLQPSKISLEMTIGNITLSLQHARQLFAQAQERYKAFSANTSSAANATGNTKLPAEEPGGQHSSYPRIRQSDGTVTHLERIPSITTTQATTIQPLVTVTLPTRNNASDSSSVFPTTPIFSTTTPSPSTDTPGNSTEKQNITIITPTNTAYSYILNDTSQANASTSFLPTLSPQVFRNTPFNFSNLGSLQNFTPFGAVGSNNHQNIAGLFQQPATSLNSGSSSQSPGLSNLFGLGSFPSLGTNLGSLNGFGLGQGFGSLTGGVSQAQQPSSPGLNVGYLGLLSSLTGLGLGGTSSSSELSLPNLHQDSSSSQSNNGFNFLSGLPSLSLSGLGNLGNLGNLASIPGLGSLEGASGTSGSSLGSLSGSGLAGLGLTNNGGVSGFGVGTGGGLHSLRLPDSTAGSFSGIGTGSSGLASILGKITPPANLAPVLGETAGSITKFSQPTANVEDPLTAVNTHVVLPAGDTKLTDVPAGDTLNK